jgi:hypothetical protein
MKNKEQAALTSSQNTPPQKAKTHAARAGNLPAPETKKDPPSSAPADLLPTFFASVSPRKAGEWLKKVTPQQLVFILSQMRSGPGSDSMFIEWSRLHLQSFESFNIESDIERLVDLGIRRETIAMAMMAIKLSPQFDGMFGALGDKRTRRRRARTLLSPVPVLQDLEALFGKAPDELPTDKVPNPTKLISELRLLSSMFTWGEWLYEFLGANSLFEISRFALASLVFEVSGKFLDREVSNLVGASLRDYDYDENRHRVWRISNYERLQRNVPIATRVLVALNTVVTQSKSSS